MPDDAMPGATGRALGFAPMLDTAALVVSLLLAGTFGWAALAKAFGWERWRAALGRYGLGRRLERAALVTVPVAEAAACVLLAFGSMRAGGALALALVSAFSLAVVRARSRHGDELPCGCFGGTDARDYRAILARNSLLGVGAAFVVLAGAGSSLSAPSPGEYLPAALAAIGVLAVLWLVWQAGTSLRR